MAEYVTENYKITRWHGCIDCVILKWIFEVSDSVVETYKSHFFMFWVF